MTPPPVQPKIYHITHIDNLASIAATGCIESDGRRFRLEQNQTAIGMTEIKRRRLFELDVPCHSGSKVGDYVPFYFCPRSIMLFILYCNNHPDMAYHGGQEPILHLQADLGAVINWANERSVSWAFSDRNAGSYYTDFYDNLDDLGKIDWDAIRETNFRDPIESAFKDIKDVTVLIYEPKGAPPAEEMKPNTKPPRLTVGRAALLVLMRRYLAAVMDPFVTLLEIHKLMYFMQESGEGLKLQYQKGLYGPYAQNLRHVLNLMEGHFISGYGDAEDNPNRQINLMPEVLPKAETFLENHPDTRDHFQKVVELISGFETPFGMELLSTVHWVANHEEAATADQAVKQTYEWNSRKRMFQEKHIRLAWNILEQKGWLPQSIQTA